MNKKIIAFLSIAAVLLSTSCNSDNEPDNPGTEPGLQEGMEMYTRAFKDGQLIEEVIDEVKNFGTSDNPLLFHVNKSHTMNGEAVPPGRADLNGMFLSLTQEEYDGFIGLFAVMRGLAETDKLTDSQKKEAFAALFAYLKQYDIDLPLLVYLAEGSVEELKAAERIVSADSSRADDSGMEANNKLRYMLQKGIKPSEAGAETVGIETRSDYVSDPSRLVVGEKVYDSSHKFRLVHDAKKVDDYDQLFASFINIHDLDISHYKSQASHERGDYEVTYGSKLTPMSHIKFDVSAYFKSKCQTLRGYYVEKVEVGVLEASRTALMRCDLDVSYNTPTTYDYSNQDGCFASKANWNEVIVTYGDKACITYKGTLTFHVDAMSGIQEFSWQAR